MKKTYNKLDYVLLTCPTGDPFVDAGGYALDTMSNLFPNDDIMGLIMRAADIYVDRWKAKINPFFLNSKITQPAFKDASKKSETKKYYEGMLNNEGGHVGYCRVTGRETYVFPAGRDNSVLSGSRTFINFHHGFQSGIMLSKEVLIRLFFLPLACEQLQGRIALISSSSLKIAKYFSQEVCKENLSAVANNSSEGVLKAKSNNPSTSLFRYADRIIYEFKSEFDEDNESLTLYHFTNFGASPDLEIYQLPFQMLRFYSFVQKAKYRDSWNAFVNHHYHYTGASYDAGKYVIKNKKESQTVDEDTFKYWRNTVYDNLLKGRSLTSAFLSYIREHQFDFKIIKTYETKIRNMKKETIEKIEQLADFIMSTYDAAGVAKVVRKLDGVTNSYLLRRFVIKDIVEKNYDEGNEEPIVTVKDYANYLFPDTDSWKETRDVLIIAIFERLHQRHEEITILKQNDNQL